MNVRTLVLYGVLVVFVGVGWGTFLHFANIDSLWLKMGLGVGFVIFILLLNLLLNLITRSLAKSHDQ